VFFLSLLSSAIGCFSGGFLLFVAVFVPGVGIYAFCDAEKGIIGYFGVGSRAYPKLNRVEQRLKTRHQFQ